VREKKAIAAVVDNVRKRGEEGWRQTDGWRKETAAGETMARTGRSSHHKGSTEKDCETIRSCEPSQTRARANFGRPRFDLVTKRSTAQGAHERRLRSWCGEGVLATCGASSVYKVAPSRRREVRVVLKPSPYRAESPSALRRSGAAWAASVKPGSGISFEPPKSHSIIGAAFFRVQVHVSLQILACRPGSNKSGFSAIQFHSRTITGRLMLAMEWRGSLSAPLSCS
jgi:hypothetical protein